jgi:hypothetical protein
VGKTRRATAVKNRASSNKQTGDDTEFVEARWPLYELNRCSRKKPGSEQLQI